MAQPNRLSGTKRFRARVKKQNNSLLPPTSLSIETRIKLMQKRAAKRSHDITAEKIKTKINLKLYHRDELFSHWKKKSHSSKKVQISSLIEQKSLLKEILLEAPKRGVHSNMYSREQNYDKGKVNQTTYKGVM